MGIDAGEPGRATPLLSSFFDTVAQNNEPQSQGFISPATLGRVKPRRFWPCLAQKFSNHPDKYTDAKSEFILEIDKKASTWKKSDDG